MTGKIPGLMDRTKLFKGILNRFLTDIRVEFKNFEDQVRKI